MQRIFGAVISLAVTICFVSNTHAQMFRRSVGGPTQYPITTGQTGNGFDLEGNRVFDGSDSGMLSVGAGTTLRITDGDQLATRTLDAATYTNDWVFEGGNDAWRTAIDNYDKLTLADRGQWHYADNTHGYYADNALATIYEEFFPHSNGNTWYYDPPVRRDQFITGTLNTNTLEVVELSFSDFTERIHDDAGAWFIDVSQDGLDFGDLALPRSQGEIGFHRRNLTLGFPALESVLMISDLDLHGAPQGESAAVPEPSTLALLLAAGLGLLMLRAFRHRR